ncbi:MAG: hypothetical protein Q4G70_15340 [Pseudomonadota bacterium]|nr:hypothetical protein [Pseudomonadota bacterium]
MSIIKKSMAGLFGLMTMITTSNAEQASKIIHVGGDGSHLAIIDTARYEGFVGNWDENDRLRKHLIAQAKKESIIAWGSGFETDWVIAVRAGMSKQQGHREFQSVISTSSGNLHLVNYDSLTMAAQFHDYRLPDQETKSYGFRVSPGRYKLRIVQLVNPDTNWWETLGKDDPAFLIEYEPAQESDLPLQTIPWASF